MPVEEIRTSTMLVYKFPENASDDDERRLAAKVLTVGKAYMVMDFFAEDGGVSFVEAQGIIFSLAMFEKA